MGLATPAALLGLTLLLPVIALYLLRRRRDEVPVSSTYLWARLLQDVEANAPWQRLRRNLLLFLQLLILLLAIFALARPFLPTLGAAGRSLIVVVDSSVSMGAVDTPAGSRLDAARAAVLQLMDGLPDDGRITVIRGGGGAEVLLANSSDALALRQTLAGLAPTATDSDLGAALTLAAAAAARTPDSEIVLLSDGGIAAVERIPTDRPLRYLPLGGSDDNQAVSLVEVTTDGEGSRSLFVQVTNYGQGAVSRRLTVTVDDAPFTAIDLDLPPGEAVSRLLPLSVGEGAGVRVRLEGSDVLAADDVGWVVAGPAGARRVRVLTPSDGNRFLSLPFAILPDVQVEVSRLLSETQSAAPADLLVLDRWLPASGLPGSTENLLIVSPPSGHDLIQVTGVYTNPFPVGSGALPELERDLFFEPDLFFVEASRGILPPWGTAVLVDASTGDPLLWVGEFDGRRVAVLHLALFGEPQSVILDPPREVVLTNLVYQPAYPVLISLLADYLLAGPAGGLAQRSILPGQPLTLPRLDADRVEIVPPDGPAIRPAAAPDDPSVTYVPPSPGIYEVRWIGSEQAPIRFAVNLLLPTESRVAPVDDLALATTAADVGGAVETPVEGRRFFWRPLLLAALALLAVEWAVYQRDGLARLRVILNERRAGT